MKNETIEIIVRGVCVKDDQLLVCHTEYAANTYLPGGHIDFNESAEQALRREMREELGLDCTVGGFLGAVEHRFVQKDVLHCEINLVFALEFSDVNAGVEPVSCENHINFAWVKVDSLLDSHLEPCVLKTLIGGWQNSVGDGGRWGSTYK